MKLIRSARQIVEINAGLQAHLSLQSRLPLSYEKSQLGETLSLGDIFPWIFTIDFHRLCTVLNTLLVGGFNPIEKYAGQIGSFPNWGENTKIFEPKNLAYILFHAQFILQFSNWEGISEFVPNLKNKNTVETKKTPLKKPFCQATLAETWKWSKASKSGWSNSLRYWYTSLRSHSIHWNAMPTAPVQAVQSPPNRCFSKLRNTTRTVICFFFRRVWGGYYPSVQPLGQATDKSRRKHHQSTSKNNCCRLNHHLFNQSTYHSLSIGT